MVYRMPLAGIFCFPTNSAATLVRTTVLESSTDHDPAADGVHLNVRSTAIDLLVEVTGIRVQPCEVVTIDVRRLRQIV